MLRPINKIFTTPHFSRAFDPKLKTHALKGKLKGLWAYSVDGSHRILFEFLASDEVLYHDVGPHAIYG